MLQRILVSTKMSIIDTINNLTHKIIIMIHLIIVVVIFKQYWLLTTRGTKLIP